MRHAVFASVVIAVLAADCGKSGSGADGGDDGGTVAENCLQRLYRECGLTGPCQCSHDDAGVTNIVFASGATTHARVESTCPPVTGVSTVSATRSDGGECFLYRKVISTAVCETTAHEWTGPDGGRIATATERNAGCELDCAGSVGGMGGGGNDCTGQITLPRCDGC